MSLESNIWQTLEGGYKIPYDASIPLSQLYSENSQETINQIFDDLWENLHHQGDVGLASYYSVPELVSSCITKNSFDWNYIGLCLVIEHCRQEPHNPALPEEFKPIYFESLHKLERHLLTNFNNMTDPTSLRLALALFATVNGQPNLGKAIEHLDEDMTNEFLQQFSNPSNKDD